MAQPTTREELADLLLQDPAFVNLASNEQQLLFNDMAASLNLTDQAVTPVPFKRISSSSPLRAPNLNDVRRASAETELEITQRTNPLKEAIQGAREFLPRSIGEAINPLQQGRRALGALRTAGGAFRTAEAGIASAGLGIQKRGFSNLAATGREVAAGLRGERPAELGDIARASGVINTDTVTGRALASGIGLAATAGTGLASKTFRKGLQAGSRRVTEAATRPARSVVSLARRERTVRRVQMDVKIAKAQINRQFGNRLRRIERANPGVTTDLSVPISRLRDTAGVTPALRQQLKLLIRRSPGDGELLRTVLNDPTTATRMSLRDAQRLKRALRQLPSAKRRLPIQTGVDDTTSAILDAIDDISQAEFRAFPGFRTLARRHAKLMDDYRIARKALSDTAAEASIFGNRLPNPFTRFTSGGALEGVVQRNAFKRLLTAGKRSKTVRDVLGPGGTRQAGTGLALAGGAAAALGARAFFRGISRGGDFVGGE